LTANKPLAQIHGVKLWVQPRNGGCRSPRIQRRWRRRCRWWWWWEKRYVDQRRKRARQLAVSAIQAPAVEGDKNAGVGGNVQEVSVATRDCNLAEAHLSIEEVFELILATTVNGLTKGAIPQLINRACLSATPHWTLGPPGPAIAVIEPYLLGPHNGIVSCELPA